MSGTGTFSGFVVRLLCTALLAVAGAASARLGMADRLAERSPGKALEWSMQPEAQSREVQRLAVEKEDLAAARSLAEQMLEASPLRGTAYAALARATDDEARAARLMAIAARLSPRERGTQAWLADHHAAAGRFEEAVEHFDQLLKLSPRQAHTVMPALLSLAMHPEGLAAVADRMGRDAPSWRERFLRAWAQAAPNDAMLDTLFGRLRSAPHPLATAERDQWIARLVQRGRIASAYFIWVDGLTEVQRTHVGNIFDGGFELLSVDGGFGWKFGRVPGASVRQQPGAGVSGSRALVVEFQHRRVPFEHVQQLLALPKGKYRLSGRVRLDDLRTDRGLVWTIECAQKRLPLGHSPSFAGRQSWLDFESVFEVPGEDCAAQVLRLRLDARTPAEQWVGGRVWFDDLRIRREPGDRPGDARPSGDPGPR